MEHTKVQVSKDECWETNHAHSMKPPFTVPASWMRRRFGSAHALLGCGGGSVRQPHVPLQ
jgi:hypothetical protein